MMLICWISYQSLHGQHLSIRNQIPPILLNYSLYESLIRHLIRTAPLKNDPILPFLIFIILVNEYKVRTRSSQSQCPFLFSFFKDYAINT